MLALPLQSLAFDEEKSEEETYLKHLKPAADHLLALTGANSQMGFDADQIAPLLEFVISSKDPEKNYTLGQRKGGTSAYYEFTVNRSLKNMLDLAYNPAIPSFVTTPSSIRLAQWLEIEGKRQPLPKLSDTLENLSSPMTVKGVEFIENTPDATSGAYYSYKLDRTLILMKYQGQPVMLSISNQQDKSDVGKKGLVVGPDEQWNYVYTGEKGCTKRGFAWADSYMYSSSSIMVYYQTNDPVPQVKCGSFKWLKAGWAGINLAQPHHLREGIARFATTYKAILESPALTDVTKVTRMFKQIETLSTEELREKSRLYFQHLVQRYQNYNRHTRKWFSQLFKDGNYIASMTRQEMKAIVYVEYLKHLLGKDQPFDIGYFHPSETAAKRPG